jgi:hypothetical protein
MTATPPAWGGLGTGPAFEPSQFLSAHGDRYTSLTEARLQHSDHAIYEVKRRRMNAYVGSPVYGDHYVHQVHEPRGSTRDPLPGEQRWGTETYSKMDRAGTWQAGPPVTAPGARPLGPGGRR